MAEEQSEGVEEVVEEQRSRWRRGAPWSSRPSSWCEHGPGERFVTLCCVFSALIPRKSLVSDTPFLAFRLLVFYGFIIPSSFYAVKHYLWKHFFLLVNNQTKVW